MINRQEKRSESVLVARGGGGVQKVTLVKKNGSEINT
jgi:hypothetical protein